LLPTSGRPIKRVPRRRFTGMGGRHVGGEDREDGGLRAFLARRSRSLYQVYLETRDDPSVQWVGWPQTGSQFLGAPGERQDDEERGKPSLPVHPFPPRRPIRRAHQP